MTRKNIADAERALDEAKDKAKHLKALFKDAKKAVKRARKTLRGLQEEEGAIEEAGAGKRATPTKVKIDSAATTTAAVAKKPARPKRKIANSPEPRRTPRVKKKRKALAKRIDTDKGVATPPNEPSTDSIVSETAETIDKES